MLVVDASVTMAWCFREEASEASDAILDDLKDGAAHVPSLWPYEVANVLIQGERRGRVTRERTDDFLAQLGALPIVVHQRPGAGEFDAVLACARAHRLTTYDAAYLELALRLGLPLATRDADLARAAREAGIALVPT